MLEPSRDDLMNLIEPSIALARPLDRRKMHEEPRTDSAMESIIDEAPLLETGLRPLISFHQSFPRKDETSHRIMDLIQAIEDPGSLREDIYDLYQQLPEPRPNLLSTRRLGMLLGRLWSKDVARDWPSVHYLSIIDEVQACGKHLSQKLWHTAISLVSRQYGYISSRTIEDILRWWRRFEIESGLKSEITTLNILYHAAVRGQRFGLAELIYNEMIRRDLKIDRFTRTGEIYLHGLRGDGVSVRRGYRDAVNYGEVVDVTILNCVMASLYSAGEPSAAMNVYRRLKRLHESMGEHPSAPKTRQDHRLLARRYKEITASQMDAPAEHIQAQQTANFCPNTHTFRILTRNVGMREDGIHQLEAILADLRHYAIAPDGAIFINVFRGFALFGGPGDSLWSRDQLESAWESYLNAYPPGPDKRMELGKRGWLILLRGFARCAGRERVAEVWEVVCQRWDPSPSTQARAWKIIERLPADATGGAPRNYWGL